MPARTRTSLSSSPTTMVPAEPAIALSSLPCFLSPRAAPAQRGGFPSEHSLRGHCCPQESLCTRPETTTATSRCARAPSSPAAPTPGASGASPRTRAAASSSAARCAICGCPPCARARCARTRAGGADCQAHVCPTHSVSARRTAHVSAQDGYKFLIVDAPGSSTEPFLFVSIHVADLAKARSERSSLANQRHEQQHASSISLPVFHTQSGKVFCLRNPAHTTLIPLPSCSRRTSTRPSSAGRW